jgi:hypothetical protein
MIIPNIGIINCYLSIFFLQVEFETVAPAYQCDGNYPNQTDTGDRK